MIYNMSLEGGKMWRTMSENHYLKEEVTNVE